MLSRWCSLAGVEILDVEVTDQDVHELQALGDHVASRSASAMLEDDDPGEEPWSEAKLRRKKTDAELLQEFWDDVGFPMPASRMWEKGGSSSDGEERFHPANTPSYS